MDKLRARLRAAAAEVAAAQSRPRVMVLESLQPLKIGDALACFAHCQFCVLGRVLVWKLC